MSCPDLLLLSQLLDGELAAEPARAASAHLAGCDACRARASRLERGLAATRATLAGAQPPARAGAPTPDCLSEAQIVSTLDPDAKAGARAEWAQHLDGCDECLEQVVLAMRMMARLDRGPMLPVPEALRQRVASRWPLPGTAASEIAVRVGRAGMAILESRLFAPLRDLVEIAAPPAPAWRAGEAASALSFQLMAADARIRATLLPIGDAVGLELVLESEQGDGLADQRVFLRRHGRSIYSARTDARGELRTPGLERGVYEVSCPGIATVFRLDLRD